MATDSATRKDKFLDKTKFLNNLNPHKAARIAMLLYGRRYAAQAGGSLDFWNSLSEGERQYCRELVEVLRAAPEEARHE